MLPMCESSGLLSLSESSGLLPLNESSDLIASGVSVNSQQSTRRQVLSNNVTGVSRINGNYNHVSTLTVSNILELS